MLIIQDPPYGPPNVSIRVRSFELIAVCGYMRRNSQSFYMEPYPDDYWYVTVAHDVAPRLQQFLRAFQE